MINRLGRSDQALGDLSCAIHWRAVPDFAFEPNCRCTTCIGSGRVGPLSAGEQVRRQCGALRFDCRPVGVSREA